MGWAYLDVTAGQSTYKIVASIEGTRDLEHDAADYCLELHECLRRSGLLDRVSSLKVSADKQAMVVVYLEGSGFELDVFEAVAGTLKRFDRCRGCRVCLSGRAKSPILHWIGEPEL